MSTHPYPNHLVSEFKLDDGTKIVVRPIRPEDAEIEDTFVTNLSPRSKHFRFMQALQKLTPEMLVRFTQIDYDREMAFIATRNANGKEEQIAVGRYVAHADGESCEFALVVGDAWQGKGIGRRIMLALMEVAKDHGLKRMEGEILSDNRHMLSLMKKLGFSLHLREDDPMIHEATKRL